jgi:hypothetical protein
MKPALSFLCIIRDFCKCLCSKNATKLARSPLDREDINPVWRGTAQTRKCSPKCRTLNCGEIKVLLPRADQTGFKADPKSLQLEMLAIRDSAPTDILNEFEQGPRAVINQSALPQRRTVPDGRVSGARNRCHSTLLC